MPCDSLGKVTDSYQRRWNLLAEFKKNFYIIRMRWKCASKGAFIPSGSVHLCMETSSAAISNEAKYQRKGREGWRKKGITLRGKKPILVDGSLQWGENIAAPFAQISKVTCEGKVQYRSAYGLAERREWTQNQLSWATGQELATARWMGLACWKSISRMWRLCSPQHNLTNFLPSLTTWIWKASKLP